MLPERPLLEMFALLPGRDQAARGVSSFFPFAEPVHRDSERAKDLAMLRWWRETGPTPLFCHHPPNLLTCLEGPYRTRKSEPQKPQNWVPEFDL